MNEERILELIDQGFPRERAEKIAEYEKLLTDQGFEADEAFNAAVRHVTLSDDMSVEDIEQRTTTPAGEALIKAQKEEEEADARANKFKEEVKTYQSKAREAGATEEDIDTTIAGLEGRGMPESWVAMAKELGLNPNDPFVLYELGNALGVEVALEDVESELSLTGGTVTRLSQESAEALSAAWDQLSQLQQQMTVNEVLGPDADDVMTFSYGSNTHEIRGTQLEAIRNIAGYTNQDQVRSILGAANVHGMDPGYLVIALERQGFFKQQRAGRAGLPGPEKPKTDREQMAEDTLGKLRGFFGGNDDQSTKFPGYTGRARANAESDARNKPRYAASREIFKVAEEINGLRQRYDTWTLTFIALKNQNLADKLLSGETSLSSREFEELGEFMQDFSPEMLAQLGVGISPLDVEQLSYLDSLADMSEGGAGGGGKVINVPLPNPATIHGAATSLFRDMLMREPTQAELNFWVARINEDILGQVKLPGLSEQYNPFNPAARTRQGGGAKIETSVNPDPVEQMRMAIMGSSEYKTLYAHKPAGMSEREYQSGFNSQEMVGQQRDFEAEKAGVMTGDRNTTMGAAFGRGVQQGTTPGTEANSFLQERLAKLFQLAQRMT